MGASEGHQDERAALLERWQQVDTGALERLVEKNLPWIRSVVRKRLGPRLRAKAETTGSFSRDG